MSDKLFWSLRLSHCSSFCTVYYKIATNVIVFRAGELCESRGGRPGLSSLISLSVSVDVKHHERRSFGGMLKPEIKSDQFGGRGLKQWRGLEIRLLRVLAEGCCYTHTGQSRSASFEPQTPPKTSKRVIFLRFFFFRSVHLQLIDSVH